MHSCNCNKCINVRSWCFYVSDLTINAQHKTIFYDVKHSDLQLFFYRLTDFLILMPHRLPFIVYPLSSFMWSSQYQVYKLLKSCWMDCISLWPFLEIAFTQQHLIKLLVQPDKYVRAFALYNIFGIIFITTACSAVKLFCEIKAVLYRYAHAQSSICKYLYYWLLPLVWNVLWYATQTILMRCFL